MLGSSDSNEESGRRDTWGDLAGEYVGDEEIGTKPESKNGLPAPNEDLRAPEVGDGLADAEKSAPGHEGPRHVPTEASGQRRRRGIGGTSGQASPMLGPTPISSSSSDENRLLPSVERDASSVVSVEDEELHLEEIAQEEEEEEEFISELCRPAGGVCGICGPRCNRCCLLTGLIFRKQWRTLLGIVLTALTTVFATLLVTHVVTLPFLGRHQNSFEETVANPFSIQATVVLVSGKQSSSIREIAEHYDASPYIGEIIIWNTNPDADFADALTDKVRVINVPARLGRNARFAAAVLAQHDRVVLQDDDIMLTEATMAGLLHAHRDYDTVLHGFWGAWPTEISPFAPDSDPNLLRSPLVSSRVLVASRYLFGVYFEYFPMLSHLYEDSSPEAETLDDILLSLASVRFNNGTLHVLHPDLRTGVVQLGSKSSPLEARATKARAVQECFKLLGMKLPKDMSAYDDPDTAIPILPPKQPHTTDNHR